jgi:hypothetical protein
MGKNRYDAIKRMVAIMPDGILSLDEVKRYIRMNIAATEKIVIEILWNMTDFGMIKEVEPFKYQIIKNGKM